MIHDSYKFLASHNRRGYIFQSEGMAGKVIKVVTFQLLEENYYNLALGDFRKGKADYISTTNNKDFVKVLSTVAKIVYAFWDEHPQATIVITPLDEKRSRLFHAIFRRHYETVQQKCTIFGIIGEDLREKFVVDKEYLGFELKLID
ncbi:MAG: hypothetical protein AAF849_19100 [Bacteroidota bacterium]